jgi:ATP-dependent exoDNAse (exonuclease V) beta subunit
MFSKTLQEKQQPVRETFSQQATDVGISREDTLRNLQNLIAGIPFQTTEQVRAVQNAVAQLMSGASSQAITSAIQIAQQNQAQSNYEKELAIKQAQIDQAQKLQDFQTNWEAQFKPLELAKLQMEVNKLKTGGSSFSASSLESLWGSDWDTATKKTTGQGTGGSGLSGGFSYASPNFYANAQ